MASVSLIPAPCFFGGDINLQQWVSLSRGSLLSAGRDMLDNRMMQLELEFIGFMISQRKSENTFHMARMPVERSENWGSDYFRFSVGREGSSNNRRPTE